MRTRVHLTDDKGNRLASMNLRIPMTVSKATEDKGKGTSIVDIDSDSIEKRIKKSCEMFVKTFDSNVPEG